MFAVKQIVYGPGLGARRREGRRVGVSRARVGCVGCVCVAQAQKSQTRTSSSHVALPVDLLLGDGGPGVEHVPPIVGDDVVDWLHRLVYRVRRHRNKTDLDRHGPSEGGQAHSHLVVRQVPLGGLAKVRLHGLKDEVPLVRRDGLAHAFLGVELWEHAELYARDLARGEAARAEHEEEGRGPAPPPTPATHTGSTRSCCRHRPLRSAPLLVDLAERKGAPPNGRPARRNPLPLLPSSVSGIRYKNVRDLKQGGAGLSKGWEGR